MKNRNKVSVIMIIVLFLTQVAAGCVGNDCDGMSDFDKKTHQPICIHPDGTVSR